MPANNTAERQATARRALINLIGEDLFWEMYLGSDHYYFSQGKDGAILAWFDRQEALIREAEIDDIPRRHEAELALERLLRSGG